MEVNPHQKLPQKVEWSIRPIFGFWGSFWRSKVFQNVLFPAQDADEPPCKIWRC